MIRSACIVRPLGEQRGQFGDIPGFFGNLPHGCLFGRLEVLQPAAGQRPAGPAVLVPMREQEIAVFDNHAVRRDSNIHGGDYSPAIEVHWPQPGPVLGPGGRRG
jgi:hypothetical protein